jgi:hypothetical protein
LGFVAKLTHRSSRRGMKIIVEAMVG